MHAHTHKRHAPFSIYLPPEAGAHAFVMFAEESVALKCFPSYQHEANSAVLFSPLEGLWLGLSICVFLQTGFFLGLIYKIDWKEVTRKVIKGLPMK